MGNPTSFRYLPPNRFLKSIAVRYPDQPDRLFFPHQYRQLLRLMQHRSPANRDWATFFIALSGHSGPEVDDAMLRAAHDPDADVRAEAILGLARRQRGSAFPLVRKNLAERPVMELSVKAAGYLAKRQLLPQLKRIRRFWSLDPAYLDAAIRACANGGKDDFNFD